MSRPRKQEQEGETMQPTVRVMIALVKMSEGSLSGDISAPELNAKIEEEFISKGYKLFSVNAFYSDSDSARVFFCFVKES